MLKVKQIAKQFKAKKKSFMFLFLDLPSLFYNSLEGHNNSLTSGLQLDTLSQTSVLYFFFESPNNIIYLNV